MPQTGKRQPVSTSRRALLVGASTIIAGTTLAGFAVENGVAPGRAWLSRHLGLNGPAGNIPHTGSGLFLCGSFASAARLGKTVSWAVNYPPGSAPGAKLPVVIVLHGYGGNHASAFGTRLGLDHFLARAVESGADPFAIASIDGGNTYWHKRATGEDGAAMITDEFTPLLKSRGLDTSRLALLGWSMGAYGALLLASTPSRPKFSAVSAMSIALWPTKAQSAAGAFDSEDDFAIHNLYTRQKALASLPIRIDCGTGDGFYQNDKTFVEGLAAKPAGSFQPGGHNLDYWRRMASPQLEFLANHF